jgi:hypothetical protein
VFGNDVTTHPLVLTPAGGWNESGDAGLRHSQATGTAS